MSKQGYIRRYSVIIEKVENGQFPSKVEIMEFLDGLGFEISDRTFERDLNELRNEFGVEIIYSTANRGYYIDEELSCTSDSFYRFLELACTSELIQESLKKNKKLFSLISYESTGDLNGIKWLSNLLIAIREKRAITFTHENFLTSKKTKFKIRPYFLKEYQSRWYIIGEVGWVEELRSFGIDRITDLVLTDKIFIKKNYDLEELFTGTIGLTYTDIEIEHVELLFNEIQIKYAESLPLHESQNTIGKENGFFRVELYVRPNYEFIQKILMMGDGVEVIKPIWFRDKIQKILTETLSKYKS